MRQYSFVWSSHTTIGRRQKSRNQGKRISYESGKQLIILWAQQHRIIWITAQTIYNGLEMKQNDPCFHQGILFALSTVGQLILSCVNFNVWVTRGTADVSSGCWKRSNDLSVPSQNCFLCLKHILIHIESAIEVINKSQKLSLPMLLSAEQQDFYMI